MWLQEIVRFNF